MLIGVDVLRFIFFLVIVGQLRNKL